MAWELLTYRWTLLNIDEAASGNPGPTRTRGPKRKEMRMTVAFMKTLWVFSLTRAKLRGCS